MGTRKRSICSIFVLIFLCTTNCSAFENKTTTSDCYGSSTIHHNSRVKRFFDGADPENIVQSVWGTKAISVQLTDQAGWNSLRIFGYLVGGKHCTQCCQICKSICWIWKNVASSKEENY